LRRAGGNHLHYRYAASLRIQDPLDKPI
jgi:hypothetical protein